MKTIIALILTLGFVSNIFAQADKYEAAMKEGIQLIGSNDQADLQKAANLFERISSVATEEWLPQYYLGLSELYLAGGALEQKQLETYEKHLNKAQEAVKAAFEIVGEHSEIAVLQAYVFQARIWKDPMTQGATYTPSVIGELEKAMHLDATNPRASFLMAQQLYHTPDFFGGGVEAALPHFKAAAKKYENYEPVSDLHPNWGKESNAKFLAMSEGETN